MAIIPGSSQVGERFLIPGPWEDKTYISIEHDFGSLSLRLESRNTYKIVARMEGQSIKFTNLDGKKVPPVDPNSEFGISEEEVLCLCCMPKNYPLNHPFGFQLALRNPIWGTILRTFSVLSVMDS